MVCGFLLLLLMHAVLSQLSSQLPILEVSIKWLPDWFVFFSIVRHNVGERLNSHLNLLFFFNFFHYFLLNHKSVRIDLIVLLTLFWTLTRGDALTLKVGSILSCLTLITILLRSLLVNDHVVSWAAALFLAIICWTLLPQVILENNGWCPWWVFLRFANVKGFFTKSH